MRWQYKALLQGTLSLLPESEKLNYFFQKYIASSFDDQAKIFADKLAFCAEHVDIYFAQKQTNRLPASIFELGTGWIPIVPIGLFLCGAQAIYSMDIHRLIQADLHASVLAYIQAASFEDFARHLPQIQQERFEQLQEMLRDAGALPAEELYKRLNIHLIIGDARATTFEANSLDFIISNTTMEHISRPILNEIFREFHRICQQDGLMSHLIDMGDHYSYFDRSITPYNYLRYDSRRWRWYNNKLQYQNRLRNRDYVELHRANGFEILEERLNDSPRQQLATVKLSPEFGHYTQEELAPTNTWIVSQPV